MRSLRLLSLQALIFFSAGALCAGQALALEVPRRPQGYVHDEADLLSPSFRSRLNSALAEYERMTSNQIVVAAFPSLENESLEDFSIRLAEAWKVGQKGKDNGVILLIFRDDRAMRIEVGYGLEGALTDAEAGIIISNIIAPHFKKGDYDAGIAEGISAITQAVQGEFEGRPAAYGGPPGPRPLTPEEAEAMRREARMWGLFILFAAGGLFVVDVFRYRAYRQGHRIYKDRYTFWEWFFRFALLLAVISFIFRMLFYAMLFSRGGYSGGRGGRGGFSGGGGSFGGGGASGRW